VKTISELKTPKYLVTWMIVEVEGEVKHWVSNLRIEDGWEVLNTHTDDYQHAQDAFVQCVRRVTEDL